MNLLPVRAGHTGDALLATRSKSGGTGNRETLLEALDMARASMIRLAVADARPGAGTIVFILITCGQDYLALRPDGRSAGQQNP